MALSSHTRHVSKSWYHQHSHFCDSQSFCTYFYTWNPCMVFFSWSQNSRITDNPNYAPKLLASPLLLLTRSPWLVAGGWCVLGPPMLHMTISGAVSRVPPSPAHPGPVASETSPGAEVGWATVGRVVPSSLRRVLQCKEKAPTRLQVLLVESA